MYPTEKKFLNGAQTPLHRAAENGSRQKIFQLSRAGWLLFVQDHECLTALNVFNQNHPPYLCNEIYANRAPHISEEVIDESLGRELLQAAMSGQVDVVQDLLTCGVNAMFANKRRPVGLIQSS